MNFKKGDVVVNNKSGVMYEVIATRDNWNEFDGKNLNNGKISYDLKAMYVTLSKTKEQIQEEFLETKRSGGMDKNSLYEINVGKEAPVFGNFLAVNGQGQLVMELKPSGEVVVVDKDKVKEVTPYTVKVVFGGSANPTHYETKEGVLLKNDVILTANGIGVVVEVDTKVKGVNALPVKTRKVLTEEL